MSESLGRGHRRVAPPSLTAVRGAWLLMVEALSSRVVHEFRDAGIDTLLLKGLSIERWIYRPGEQRSIADVDVLVSPTDLRAAEARLSALGFANRYDGPSPHWAEEHADGWGSSAWPLSVDLHRWLWGVRAPPLLAWRLLWDSRTTLPLAGRDVPVLGVPARALAIALHAAHHGAGGAKALADLERAVARVPEATWAQARDFAEPLDALDGLAAGLSLHADGVALRERLGLGYVDAAIFSRQSGLWAAPPTTEGLLRLGEVDGFASKLTFLRHELMPSAQFMRARSRQARLARRGRGGLWAAHCVRLATLAVQAPRGIATSRRLRREGRATRGGRGRTDG